MTSAPTQTEQPPKRQGKGGRPRGSAAYTEDKAAEICQRMAEGEPLTSICSDPRLPAYETVFKWVREDEHGFTDRYARAREQQAERWADELIELSNEATDGHTAQAARVKIDARKWVISKILPHKYGDRLNVDQRVSGQVQHQHAHVHVDLSALESLPDEQREQLVEAARIMRQVREAQGVTSGEGRDVKRVESEQQPAGSRESGQG